MEKVNFKNVICTVAIMLFQFAAFSQTYKIVGTGVMNCYNNTTTITCPVNPSDPFYGQFHGIAPSYQNNGNGTISDLNTGLMWIQSRGTKISWDSAFIKASQCTTGGYNDWRVPTIKELYSLMNFNGKSAVTRPACIAYIDTTYFGWTTGNLALGERIIDAQDWSANEYKGLTMVGDTTIFGLNTVDGRIKGYPKYQPPTNSVAQKMYVRFVRGNTSYGINSFIDNGDSTITDNATGLMWAKYDDGHGMNWQSALAFAQTRNTQNYLGHNDWRLPNAKELQSIVDYSRSLDFTGSAAVNPVFNCNAITDEGGNTDYPWYWTSTTHLDNMGAVYVTFGEALGWMKSPPSATYYTLLDVHGAGAQRSDPKSGDPHSSLYYLGNNLAGDSVFGRGPQGDVQRIGNYVRLVRTANGSTGINENKDSAPLNVFPNPFVNRIYVDKASGLENYTLLDVTGQIIWSGRNIEQKDLSTVAPGLYILKADDQKSIQTIKLLKQ